MCKRDFFHYRRGHGRHQHNHGRCRPMDRGSDEISHHRFRGFHGFLKKHHHHEKAHHHHGPRHHKEHMCRFEQPSRFCFKRNADFPYRRRRHHGIRDFFSSRRSHHQQDQRHPIRSQSC